MKMELRVLYQQTVYVSAFLGDRLSVEACRYAFALKDGIVVGRHNQYVVEIDVIEQVDSD